MLRCINSKHNSSQIQVFSLSHFLFAELQEWGGGGGMPRPVYLVPHSPEYQSKIICANSSYFKLSECEDVSIIKIIRVNFSCYLCHIVQYAYLQGLTASCPGQFILPPPPHTHTPTHLGIKVKLI